MESLFWAIVIGFAVPAFLLWLIVQAVDDLRSAITDLHKPITDIKKELDNINSALGYGGGYSRDGDIIGRLEAIERAVERSR